MAPSHTWALMALVATMTSLVTSRPAMEVVDLTYILGKETIFWQGQPPFNFTILKRGPTKQGFWAEVNAFAFGEHGGTHFDAPSHFAEGHWRAHKIPASHLVGPGVVIDVKAKVKDNADYKLTKQDVMDNEAEHGPIPDGAVVMMYTGWGRGYPNPKRMFGTNNIKDTSSYHFPSVDSEVALWLLKERNVTALGVDTPSPDSPSQTAEEPYPVHRTLLGSNVLILEYVANLEKLPPRGATIVVGSLKLRGGSGGPARILGLLNADVPTSGSDRAVALTSWLAVTVAAMMGVVGSFVAARL